VFYALFDLTEIKDIEKLQIKDGGPLLGMDNVID